MDKAAKRAAIGAYKERKVAVGIFAVRCAPAGQVWVGAAPSLDTIQNRIWFGLRLGSCPQLSAQDAWNAHGEAAFSFKVVETYDEDTAKLAQREWLKDRAAHWRAELGAKVM